MRVLNCKCGKQILVDDLDFEMLKIYNVTWNCLDGTVKAYYSNGALTLANVIMGQPREGFIWDHKDRDEHDNTRSNLRLATHAQNCANRSVLNKNTTSYKGVFYRARNKVRKYEAQVRKDGKTTYLGAFTTPDEAARVYDRAAKELFGEFAVLNFPGTQQ